MEVKLNTKKGEVGEKKLDTGHEELPKEGESTVADMPNGLANPLQIILDAVQILIVKVEALDNIKEKEKAIGKLKGVLEILSKNCN